jgi:hypothetical protein
MSITKVSLLRVFHGLFALYFLACLGYLYYAAITNHLDVIFIIAFVSLGAEGTIVYLLNHGDCPLMHIQKRLGDNTPFFELFLSPAGAKKALPFFARLTWLAVGLVILRVIIQ